jgi:hypothetical protein
MTDLIASMTDTKEEDDYYDPCYYMQERDLEQRSCSDGEFEFQETPATGRTPRSSPCLDEVVRRRTPTWISRLLKTNLPDDVELEELFANMLILGRVAEVIHGVLDTCVDDDSSRTPYRTSSSINSELAQNRNASSPVGRGQHSKVSLSLGERPYRVMVQDYESFCALCSRLEIREDSRFSFNDVEQKGAGERIGLCIWDLCNALHDKSATGELPEYVGKLIPKFTEPNVPSPSPMKKKLTVSKYLPGRSPQERNHLEQMHAGQDDAQRARGVENGSSHELDASTRVLASILTPGTRKPKHSKLLNAVMLSDFCDDGKPSRTTPERSSPLPKIVDSHDENMTSDEDDGLVQSESKNKGSVCGSEGAGVSRTVQVSKFDSKHKPAVERGGSRSPRKHPFGRLLTAVQPLAMAAIGALSVVVFQKAVDSRKERQWRRGMAGRW